MNININNHLACIRTNLSDKLYKDYNNNNKQKEKDPLKKRAFLEKYSQSV